ncbi:DUF6660 family protein [Mucilaginibacter pedocola]|uniref:Uncharacterized protein n=1 Tax=Mucilaginibacter pedocola TaxID=1792845 RepID=A0A1S9P8Q2_9SPHI|nr:hypothetical protein BC343_14690 [Mucilaginibacter pedocola]
MKWICFLLALFFICLDMEPCKDGVSLPNTSGMSIVKTHQDHQSTQDQCPPLCHCGCCNMQVVIASKLIISPVTVKLAEMRASFLPESPVTRPSNIWQPPKLNA